MAKIFNTHPDLTSDVSRVTKVRETAESRLGVMLQENILRPAGGGQPQDFGVLTPEYGSAPVGRISKMDGDT